MSADPAIKLPKVAVIFQEERRRRELEHALNRRFDLSIFDDVGAAGDGMAAAAPDVALVDLQMAKRGGIDRLGLDGTTVSIIFIGVKGEGAGDLLERFGKTSRFLSWPMSSKALIETISDLISQSAEKAWEALPEVQQKPLKLTVEEYQSISTAIENGEPIDYGTAAESCTPLVDAVNQAAHHDLLASVQSHHNYTYVHSMRVATLLTLFGHGIGMSDDDLLILSTGGLLHDVGKLVTPPEILGKPGKLTDEEWPLMQDHVVQSGVLLEGGDDVRKGARIIAEQHHEKIDGTGYPKGLKGAELNELARMSAICDIFGALTDERSYKPAFPTEKAFAILESMTTGIDQNLLALFKEIFVSTKAEQAA